MTNLRRKEGKPGTDIAMKRQTQVKELGPLTLIIAGKGTALKGIENIFCIGFRLLSSA